LVGPYPEARALYRERSAIARADEIDVPLIIFQGAEDRVVPPNQSQFMADSLRKRGVPVVYIEFEGEAHGFRKFETNVCVLQSELSFWGQVFGFEPADDLPPLTIENL
jgi:dipeptidyl aminopeptidase/acylaminoacyl peptidase